MWALELLDLFAWHNCRHCGWYSQNTTRVMVSLLATCVFDTLTKNLLYQWWTEHANSRLYHRSSAQIVSLHSEQQNNAVAQLKTT